MLGVALVTSCCTWMAHLVNDSGWQFTLMRLQGVGEHWLVSAWKRFPSTVGGHKGEQLAALAQHLGHREGSTATHTKCAVIRFVLGWA